MDKNIVMTIENLKEKTKSYGDLKSKLDVPTKFNIDCHQTYRSYLHGEYDTLVTDDMTLLQANNIPYTSASDYIHNYKEPLDVLIEKGEVQPFLLFLNGWFIKWEDIIVIEDCNYSFLLIKNNGLLIKPRVDSILLPCNVEYKRNEEAIVNENTIFAFDDFGFYDMKNPVVVINNKQKDLYWETFDTDSKYYQAILDNNYIILEDNVIIFKDKLYDWDVQIKNEGLNVLSFTNKENTIKAKGIIFSNLIPTGQKDIVNEIDKKRYLADRLVEDTTSYPSWIVNILKRFDFKHDRNKEYQDNLNNTLKYIMNYNPNILNDVLKIDLQIESNFYTGEYIKNHLQENKYFQINNLSKDKKINNGIIVYHNGFLLSTYNSITLTPYNKWNIPIPSDIKDKDIIEVQWFYNISNVEQEILLDRTNTTDLYDIDDDFIDNEIAIVSKTPLPNTEEFDIDRHSNWFKVNTKKLEKINNKLKIIPSSSYYYNKYITLVSKRCFLHDTYKGQPGQEYNFINLSILNPLYVKVEELGSLIVFINSKKINRSEYFITSTEESRPFFDTSIYFNFVLEDTDVVDIFFIPYNIEEIDIDTISSNGIVKIDKGQLKYGMDKDLYWIYLNGRKLRVDKLDNISTNVFNILTGYSNNNLNIVKVVDENEVLSKLYNEDNLLNKCVEEFISNGNVGTIIDDSVSIYNTDRDKLDRHQYSDKDVVYDIMRDYYMAPYVNKGELVKYDYEEVDGMIYDSNGNIVTSDMNQDRD